MNANAMISHNKGDGMYTTLFADDVKLGLAQAKLLQQKQAQCVKIVLSEGVHKIEKPVVISGNDYPCGLILTAQSAGTSVLDGSVSLDADQFEKQGDYFVYQFQSDENGQYPIFHDFYDNGKRIPVSKSATTVLKDCFPDKKNRENPANLLGFYMDEEYLKTLGDFTHPMEFHVELEWEYHMLHAIGVDESDRAVRDGKNCVQLKFVPSELLVFVKSHHDYLSVMNRKVHFRNHENLLTPGTWAYDVQKGKLYYMPEMGKPVSPAYSVTERLLEIVDGENIRIDNLKFTGTGCVLPVKSGYFSGQANTELMHDVLPCSAIFLRNTKNISIWNCDFAELGTNGVQSKDRAENIAIENCCFHNIAMCAITLGNHCQQWIQGEENINLRIINNWIDTIGMDFPTCPAVYIGHVDGLKLLYNTIRNVSYSGISVGWNWDSATFSYGESVNIKDAEIAYNRVENFMQVLRDGGAIYVLGGNCRIDDPSLFNFMHDNYAVRPQDTKEQNNSRGYYLDGSSSNWHVYRNVISGAYFPLFIQFHVKDQFNHNVLAERIYSTDEIDPQNMAPERNVTLRDCYVVPKMKRLLAQYPEAKQIVENAGCKRTHPAG